MNGADIYRESIDHLESIIGAFEQELERPELVHGTFVYKSPTVKHVCLLKGIRIVSGLNALLVMFRAGYVTEMGVLIRTIGDCINDIYFLLEHYPDITPEVEKYMSDFFNEDIDEPKIAQDQERKIHRTKARKIYASRARLLSEHINFSVGRDIVYKIYGVYSGYVHSAYPNIMEMYGGQPPCKFHLQGMKGTPRMKDWEKTLVTFIQSATLVFGYVAEKYNKAELTHEIRKAVNWFARKTMYVDRAP